MSRERIRVRPLRALVGAWKRLRAWRRIRFTGGGLVFTGGTFAVGFAAVNTGNNLLYLLLGVMLGVIVVSGWISERTLGTLDVERDVPRGVTAGQSAPVTYRVRGPLGRLPSFAVEISEEALPERAFLGVVAPGERATARAFNTLPKRGVVTLSAVTLSTGFPFGLFVRSRDVDRPAQLVVWPRSDRSVQPPAPAGGSRRDALRTLSGGPPSRGEYRSLAEYRLGDDARDIHWRTSARLSTPVVKQYEAEAGDNLWICLDTREPPGELAEALVEVAASLAGYAAREGRPFGLSAGQRTVGHGSGPAHLEAALDLLARVEVGPAEAPPHSPPPGAHSVLVSGSAVSRGPFSELRGAAAA